jgi:hypothetical protein
MSNQPYDPYIPTEGENAKTSQSGNSRTAALQAVSLPNLQAWLNAISNLLSLSRSDS